mmetsp:Transcript_530/g.1546  ORF Transcript_530/g.1546 Transcript_530/m.1546 type:complete len:153 (+) Transcript_530:1397-1855(+)
MARSKSFWAISLRARVRDMVRPAPCDDEFHDCGSPFPRVMYVQLCVHRSVSLDSKGVSLHRQQNLRSHTAWYDTILSLLCRCGTLSGDPQSLRTTLFTLTIVVMDVDGSMPFSVFSCYLFNDLQHDVLHCFAVLVGVLLAPFHVSQIVTAVS